MPAAAGPGLIFWHNDGETPSPSGTTQGIQLQENRTDAYRYSPPVMQEIMQVGIPYTRGRFWRVLFCAFAAMTLAGAACPQRLIVRTTTRSADRTPTRVQLHSTDLSLRASLPGPECLPGQSPLCPLLALHGGKELIALTRYTSGPGNRVENPPLTFITAFETSPLRRIAQTRLPEDLSFADACIIESAVENASLLAVAAVPLKQVQGGRGVLVIYRCNSESPSSFLGEPSFLRLPGPPVAVSPVGQHGGLAVLCHAAEDPGILHRVRFSPAGAELGPAVTLELDSEKAYGVEMKDLARSRDASCLFAVSTGRALDRPGGEETSWLYAVDAASWAVAAPLVELPGGASSHALISGAGSSCWATTRSPGQGFGYVFHVAHGAGALTKLAEQSYMDVSEHVLLALAPNGVDAAVAAGQRLEVWQQGLPGGPSLTFESPANALSWEPGGLLASEAGLLHLVDPANGSVIDSILYQQGWVTGLYEIPEDALPTPDRDADGLTDDIELAMGTDPQNPDTDSDGIADGVDPWPRHKSPRLELPPVVTLRGKAAGRQWRTLAINRTHALNWQWNIYYESEDMPWLRVYPLGGVADRSNWFSIGVDPSAYGAPDTVISGFFHVTLTSPVTSQPAAGSPSSVEVRIIPDPEKARRILWIWEKLPGNRSMRSPTDPTGLAALADALSGPPVYFSHDEHAGPFFGSLDRYAVVVVDAAAAAVGTVTRQALSGYVADGGALLLLGGAVTHGSERSLARWLDPAGIRVRSEPSISGVFPSIARNRLLRHWDNFELRNGCTIELEGQPTIFVPGPTGSDTVVFAAREYGIGRIAVLAAPTPLQSPAFENEPQRRFAVDLFHWLSEAGRVIRDVDADGLPDSVEDRNGNWIADPSETDRINADTDGDGVPDGLEDANRNGRVDPGETSPLNVDSDGDGVWDGADPHPRPPLDAPQIAAIEPTHGPAEGGTPVLISGQSFEAGTVVWFGPMRSPSTRTVAGTALLTETPPYPQEAGGTVKVQVINPGTGHESILLAGFHYNPRSEVRITLESLAASVGAYQGMLSVQFDKPDNVAVGHVALEIACAQEDAVRWENATAGLGATGAGRRVSSQVDPLGGIHIDVLSGERFLDSGEVAKVRWQTTESLRSLGTLDFSIETAVALAPNGERLNVARRGISVRPAHARTEMRPSEKPNVLAPYP
jgi:hypothetical protein